VYEERGADEEEEEELLLFLLFLSETTRATVFPIGKNVES
jgi:hypothetical protein